MFDDDDFFEEGYEEGFCDGRRSGSGSKTPKRSGSGNKTPKQSSDGCYVATCVYGSYDCPQVWTLRRFRDGFLGRHFLGRCFIRAYYAVSPTLVRLFGDAQWFRRLWRGRLDRMVARLRQKGYADTPYRDRAWR